VGFFQIGDPEGEREQQRFDTCRADDEQANRVRLALHAAEHTFADGVDGLGIHWAILGKNGRFGSIAHSRRRDRAPSKGSVRSRCSPSRAALRGWLIRR